MTTFGSALAVAAWLVVAAPASAQDAATEPAAPAEVAIPAASDPGDEEPPARPLIERSLVIVPEQAGPFRLVGFKDFPGQPAMGVGARYAHDEFPDVMLDLFIYPFGDHARDPALDRMVELMRDELREVEASGRYEALAFGEPEPVDLQRVDADGALRPVREGLLGRGDSLSVDTEAAKRDLDGTIARESARVEQHVRDATDPDLGRRLPMRFRIDGTERQSVSFLFLRSLYAFKARATAGMTASPDSFARLTNRAMADILPAVEIRNTGACAVNAVEIDPSGDRDAGALVLVAKMKVAMVRAERHACDETLDETVPPGKRALALDVAPLFIP